MRTRMYSIKSFISPRFLIGQYVTLHGDVVSHVNISRVRVEDGGQYACSASNRAGVMEHRARLNIYGERAEIRNLHDFLLQVCHIKNELDLFKNVFFFNKSQALSLQRQFRQY